MCGFAGLLRWEGLEPDDMFRIRAAAHALLHRGPDSGGFFTDSHVALGFRRLKIIDLSAAGEQPMANEDASIQVVFNGEIYNYRELAGPLRQRGHILKSNSDTEVLLHLYEEHGEEMLPMLRGMFAFAIWDSRKRKLFLARDPLGVKPLYLAERPGFVAFASEAKAFFAMGIKAEIDPAAIHEALTYRYVPPPRSGFKDIEKLPPGNFAIAESGNLRYRRWYLPSQIKADAGETGLRLKNAVSRRLLSDVPFGAWLSGGIDSGLVLAHMGEGVKTFCAGFAQAEYDERDLARASAAHLKSHHADFEIPADVFKFLPWIVWHCDEPYFDSSCLPAYVLAQKTKPHVTVVLSGDGGDEAFCGYDRYVGMGLYARYKKTPSLFRRASLAYAKWRFPAASRQGWDRMLRWLEKCRLMEAAGHHPYIAAMELFSEEQKSGLYGEVMTESIEGADAREYLENALLRAREAAGLDADQITPGLLQRADLETYLSGDVLHKVDRMSMAHGLEVRSPFLDVDLVGFALSLPDREKLPGRQTKPLLRQAAEKLLPAEVAGARKRGFGVPLDDWFRGPLQAQARSMFEESRLAGDGIFRSGFWEPLWTEHLAKKAQHGERLYALLSLETWYRMFIKNAVPQQPPGN